eukprot:s5050_g3.t1
MMYLYLVPRVMFNFKLRKAYSKLRVMDNLDLLSLRLNLHKLVVALTLLDNMKLQLVHKVMFDFIVHEVYSELRVMNNLVLFVRRELNNKVQMTDALYQNKLLEIFTSLRLKMYHRTKDLLLKR